MNIKRIIGFSLPCALWIATDLLGAEPAMLDVLRSCPKTANAIVQGDLVALRKLTVGSPLAEDLPGNVVRVRIAAEIDLESLQPKWEIGYAAVTKMATAESLAHAKAVTSTTCRDDRSFGLPTKCTWSP